MFILAEHIGRIGEQVRGRPLYVIKSVVTSQCRVEEESRVMS